MFVVIFQNNTFLDSQIFDHVVTKIETETTHLVFLYLSGRTQQIYGFSSVLFLYNFFTTNMLSFVLWYGVNL